MAKEIDLFLVVPPGVDRAIYPWGVNSLSDYVSHFGLATPRIWALGEEPWLEDVAAKHAGPLAEATFALTKAARGVFVGHTASPDLFLGVVGALGEEFLAIAGRRGLLRFPPPRGPRGRLGLALAAVKRDYEARLREGVRACLEISGAPSGGRVWGVSVYDYTLFNSLFLCRVVRELDPSATILFGGDYFDYASAGQLLRACPEVDAAVVGYGEAVLSEVLGALARGRGVGSLQAAGLVTRGALAVRGAAMEAADVALGLGKAGRAEREASVSVPASYREAGAAPPVDYVREQEDGTVRVLTQRGCSWGKCTFCSQLDRRLFFPLGLDSIVGRLEASLATTGGPAPRHVSLDADENDLNAVLPLLDVVRRSPGRYTVEFWLMARKFGAELPRFLGRCGNVKLTVVLNVESLSQRTLKRMKKGVVPLQIVEAVKAVQDSGHDVRTNYFLNFPGEGPESVREEADVLERVLHLFTSERMHVAAFSYMANTRDEIHFDAGRYGALSGRLREDVWLKEAFGVDLPFSIWAVENRRPLRGLAPRDLLPFTFHKLSFARRAELLSEAGLRAFGGPKGRARPLLRLLEGLERVELRAWSLAHGLSQRLSRDDAYGRRRAVFEHVGSPEGRRTRFFVDGTELVKEWHLRGAERQFRRGLSADELALLRFLYWRRKRPEIVRRFAGRAGEAVDGMLSRLQGLGAVVDDGRCYLSDVHDPGYWQTEESTREGPSALTDLEPRQPELKGPEPKRRRLAVAT